MTYDVAALRAQEYPWMDPATAVHLNSASTGPLPARTVRAVGAFTALRHDPRAMPDTLLFDTLTRSRALAAALIHADAGEIALSVNTSYGINVAAAALPLGPGDVVVVPDGEFPANMYPWLELAPRRGATVRVVPLRDGWCDEESLMAAVDDPAVKIVAVSWVGFATGYRVDLAALGRRCRERGVHLVVDAIQGLGVLPLDVREVQPAILACGAQKWLLSPWGAGFTYVRRDLIPRLDPPFVSWMGVRNSDDFRNLLAYDLTWRDDARRFEFVTVPFQDFAGMNASVELLLELGPAAVAAHVRRLADRVVEWTGGRRGMRLVTPADAARRAGIVCVAPPDPEATSERLKAAGVIHSQREGAMRLAIHAFTTDADIDRALAVIGGA
ncbi:MAG: aminotransferase class V-fold PLP-dependent enzyme [Gemmatimonadota bacterium]|nr:aminotransferase class V-fold PLP-dependent enzyme [Gemmatimonadota bacterium]MDE3126960.1 aminotransferase class V-fold PLP-dependent enzyme [Gemmatimonadota bacterium]MDE3174422.1 aminotransferase class V-fold PLP-dependent enzyme [Gemmatimonadota bacterium]MDE3214981.1 aminotransferase class V-fold PLP-dependent enzyme [Gemmatimonadota bacterium]